MDADGMTEEALLKGPERGAVRVGDDMHEPVPCQADRARTDWMRHVSIPPSIIGCSRCWPILMKDAYYRGAGS